MIYLRAIGIWISDRMIAYGDNSPLNDCVNWGGALALAKALEGLR